MITALAGSFLDASLLLNHVNHVNPVDDRFAAQK